MGVSDVVRITRHQHHGTDRHLAVSKEAGMQGSQHNLAPTAETFPFSLYLAQFIRAEGAPTKTKKDFWQAEMTMRDLQMRKDAYLVLQLPQHESEKLRQRDPATVMLPGRMDGCNIIIFLSHSARPSAAHTDTHTPAQRARGADNPAVLNRR